MTASTTTEERVRQELAKLVGLPLEGIGRSADMRQFHFGPSRLYKGRFVGEFALHVQCPWRLDGPDAVVTGRADLWETADGSVPDDRETWDYDVGPNLQDRRLAEWLGAAGPGRVLHPDPGLPPVVVLAVRATAFGGAEIDLSGGHRLTLFPGGSTGEDWRLFRPGGDDETPHFVVGSGRIEE